MQRRLWQDDRSARRLCSAGDVSLRVARRKAANEQGAPSRNFVGLVPRAPPESLPRLVLKPLDGVDHGPALIEHPRKARRAAMQKVCGDSHHDAV